MDEAKFLELYEHTARDLKVYVYRVTRNAALVDDMVQEAYMRFLRSSAVGLGVSEARLYLFRIVTNLMRDHWRKFYRKGQEPSWDEPDHEQTEPAAAEGRLSKEERMDVQRALEYLRPRQRSLLWLAYVEGYEHREIAEVLGLRKGSVGVLLVRVKSRFLELMGSRQPGKELK